MQANDVVVVDQFGLAGSGLDARRVKRCGSSGARRQHGRGANERSGEDPGSEEERMTHGGQILHCTRDDGIEPIRNAIIQENAEQIANTGRD
jgi:hypothetical protein